MKAQEYLQFMAFHFSLARSFCIFGPELYELNDIRPTLQNTFFRVFLCPSDIRSATDISHWLSKEAKSYEALIENLETISDAMESGDVGFLAQIYTPNYSGFVSRAMECDAYRGLCDLALAVTAYRAANGNYPSALEKLVPDYITRIPVDPFDGLPLKMEPVEGGLKLYSVSRHTKHRDLETKSPIQFYLGREVYKKYRVKPAKEKRLEEGSKGKKEA